MTVEFKTLILEDENGVIVPKYIYTKFPLSRLGVDAAAMNGFIEVDEHWVRELTDEIIARELREEQHYINRGLFNFEDLPDWVFKGAWILADGVVKVDMDKARVIHMKRIRKVRNAELDRLDIETMKALDSQDNKKSAEVGAKKQALRDIPETFDLSIATTPEELKALWPEELKPK